MQLNNIKKGCSDGHLGAKREEYQERRCKEGQTQDMKCKAMDGVKD